MVRSPSVSVPGASKHRRWRTACAKQFACLAATVLAAQMAQAQATATRPNPLDPKASVPTLRYESSFAQYRKLGDGKPVSWRDANDTVTRIGGWRVYAREAQQADPPPAATPGPAATAASAAKEADVKPAAQPQDAAKPMPAGHSGHKTP